MSDIIIVISVFIVAVLVAGGIEQGLVSLLSRSSEPVLRTEKPRKQLRQSWVISGIIGWNVIAITALAVFGEDAFFVTVGATFVLYLCFKIWLWKNPAYERYFCKPDDADREKKE